MAGLRCAGMSERREGKAKVRGNAGRGICAGQPRCTGMRGASASALAGWRFGTGVVGPSWSRLCKRTALRFWNPLVPGKVSRTAEFEKGGLRHGARMAAVKAAFWNLAVSGKVSKSAEIGCILVHGVGTAETPRRVKQCFVAPSVQNLH
jgi:hypothetical protein